MWRAFTVFSKWICVEFGFSHGARSTATTSTTNCENARPVPDVDLVSVLAQCGRNEASRYLLELNEFNVSVRMVSWHECLTLRTAENQLTLKRTTLDRVVDQTAVFGSWWDHRVEKCELDFMNTVPCE